MGDETVKRSSGAPLAGRKLFVDPAASDREIVGELIQRAGGVVTNELGGDIYAVVTPDITSGPAAEHAERVGLPLLTPTAAVTQIVEELERASAVEAVVSVTGLEPEITLPSAPSPPPANLIPPAAAQPHRPPAPPPQTFAPPAPQPAGPAGMPMAPAGYGMPTAGPTTAGGSPALQYAIASYAAQGFHLEVNNGQQAVMAKPARVNHAAYFLIGIFTCGLVWLLWLLAAVTAKDTRVILTAMPDGQIDAQFRHGK